MNEWPPSSGPKPEEDPLLHIVLQWASEARSDQARARRIATHWHDQATSESMRFTGLLQDLLERSLPVSIGTQSGRSYSGRVTALGQDFFALTSSPGTTVAIALGATSFISLDESPRRIRQASDRLPDAQSQRLFDVLTELARNRMRVRFLLRGSSDIRVGEISSVGLDAVTVLQQARPNTVVIPDFAFSELWINQ